jgi:hypothetical protein
VQTPLQTVAPVGFNIAVDPNYVYWSGYYGGGDLFALPLDGGPLKSLSSAGTGVVTVESGVVYWLIGGSVWAAASSSDGGASAQIATGDNCCTEDVVASGGVLYFGGSGGAILSVAETGGAVTPLYSGGPSSAYIAVANGNVYWTDADENIASVAEDGGAFARTDRGRQHLDLLGQRKRARAAHAEVTLRDASDAKATFHDSSDRSTGGSTADPATTPSMKSRNRPPKLGRAILQAARTPGLLARSRAPATTVSNASSFNSPSSR